MKTQITDPAIRHIHEHKLRNEIAAALGIKRQALAQWTRVPHTRVLAVAKIIKWEPHQIRPDVYPAPRQSDN